MQQSETLNTHLSDSAQPGHKKFSWALLLFINYEREKAIC
jgi:hypothetical protein